MDELAERHGVEVFESPLPTPDGLTMEIGGKWFVFLKPGLSAREREFTLAHELAHSILGVGKNEAVAEACAAELLWERRLARFSTLNSGNQEPGNAGESMVKLADAMMGVHQLYPHLVDDEKKRLVGQLGATLGFASMISLVTFGIIKMADYFTRRARRR